jgi:hypothetical protein
MVHVWNLKSNMHEMNRCVPWNIVSIVENSILQSLHFQYMGVCSKFPGGSGISKPNESFVNGQFNVSAQSLNFNKECTIIKL